MNNNEKTRGLGCFNNDIDGSWERIDMYEKNTYKIPVSSIKVKGILIKNYKGFNINKRKFTNSYGLIFR